MKSESPSVSVIVSCYNYADYIVECVESLLRQDYESIEVIVVDDGSTDGSLGLLREIRDSRLKIISQRNSGQAVAWNVGFEHSRGDFIFFCDADDYFYQNKISEVMRSIAPDVALYQHDLDEIDDVGARIGGATFGGFTSRTGCALLEGNLRLKIVTEFGWYFAPSSGLMIPRAIAAKIFPIPSVYSLCADVAVAYGASMRGDVKLIRASLGTYRLHSRSGYAAHFSNKLHWGVEQFINKMQRYHLIRQGIATRDFSDDLSLVMRSPLKNLSFRVDYLRQIEPNFWVCFALLLGLRFRQLYGGRLKAHLFLAEVWRDVKALLPYRFYAKAQAIKKFRRRGMELFIASARSELLGGGMKKRVYIFGTGSFALRRLKQYRREYEIVAFLDNNVLKQGKLFEGLPVQSPVDSDWSAVDAVVIASSQFESIFAQLLSTGLPAEKLVLPLEVTRRQFLRLFESTAFPLLHVLLLALGGLKLFEIFFS